MEKEPMNLIDVVNEGKNPPPCDQTLGIQVEYARDGGSKGTWQADDSFINGNGVIMGGFVSAVADTMMAYAASSILKEGQIFASINLNSTFHRPAQKGVIEIEVRPEKLGRTVANFIAELRQNEKQIATVTSSVLLQYA